MANPIYIIDDDKDVREILCYALETEGFKAKGFPDGEFALKQLLKLPQSDFPSLILVDYFMPKMDGITFIKELRRSRPEIKDIHLALSSANENLAHSLLLPEDVLLLNKPMELDHFLNVVKEHYKKHFS